MVIKNYSDLYNFVREVFIKMGHNTEDADISTNVLLSADLRGIDSHGIARLSGYIRLWEEGRINSSPQIRVIHESISTAVIDGDKGLGLLVAFRSMKKAIEKANLAGTGWVAVKNSNHFGIAGYHSMLALEKDMIGIALTNASPLVAPTFSKQRLLGTNPISISIPAGKQHPIVVDMATTTASNGKLEVLQRRNMEAENGWLQDKYGNITTDAEAVKKGGALLPLGGTKKNGSHKGYCLGAVVDILSGVLSGANYGPWVPPFVGFLPIQDTKVGQGIGHFFGAMRIDAFQSAEEFKKNIDNWIETFKAAECINPKDKVLIPGEPEREFEENRLKNGIPLLESVVEDIKKISEKFHIPF